MPERTTANKKDSKDPKVFIDEATIIVRPAAGPLTLIWDPDKEPIITPPIMPAITPENKGAPDAKAIPKQRGNATKKTTKLAGRS